MPELIEWAKFYLSKGFSVLPADPKEKRPLIKWKDYQESLPSPEELEKWFKEKKPNEINIFLVMGPSGYFSLDFDKPELWYLFFDESPEEMAEKTWVSKTPRGLRPIFRTRAKVETTELKGVVELKAKGRGIIAPPSIRADGGVYLWLTNIEKVGVATIKAEEVRRITGIIEKLKKWWGLIEILLELWIDGIRHDEALAIAGLLRKAGIRKQEAEWIIWAVCRIKRDEEIKDRLRAVSDTYSKSKQEIAGVSILKELLTARLGIDRAEEIIERIKEAIGYDRAIRLEERDRGKAIRKVCGRADEGFYEQIEHEGRQRFLVYDGREFRILDEVHEGEKTVIPLEEGSYPYEPYRYFSGEINAKELAEEIKKEIDTFIDAEEKDKLRWTVEIFLSYVTELLPSVPYEFLFGDEECGKTQTLYLMSKLAYRPLYGHKHTASNVFTYLHSHPNSTILLDNAGDLDRDRDLADVFREGYKKGAKIPRVFDLPSGERKQVFFPCYGFKVCAERRLLKDSNLMARFITANMYEGFPEKDEFREEDLERFRLIRDKLLKWRLLTLHNGLEDTEVEARGRLKELWKPLLRVAKMIDWGYDELLEQIRKAEIEKREMRKEDVNYAIVNAVLWAIIKHGDDWIPFQSIWDGLLSTTKGIVDSKRDDVFHSEDYGDISKKLVGSRIKTLFDPVRRYMNIEGKATLYYTFSKDRVLRVVRRYICPHIVDLSIQPITGDIIERNDMLFFECQHYIELENNNCSLYISCPIAYINKSTTRASSNESRDESGDF